MIPLFRNQKIQFRRIGGQRTFESHENVKTKPTLLESHQLKKKLA